MWHVHVCNMLVGLRLSMTDVLSVRAGDSAGAQAPRRLACQAGALNRQHLMLNPYNLNLATLHAQQMGSTLTPTPKPCHLACRLFPRRRHGRTDGIVCASGISASMPLGQDRM